MDRRRSWTDDVASGVGRPSQLQSIAEQPNGEPGDIDGLLQQLGDRGIETR
jgi:hypothetical protein